jgi:hypothetical protein
MRVVLTDPSARGRQARFPSQAAASPDLAETQKQPKTKPGLGTEIPVSSTPRFTNNLAGTKVRAGQCAASVNESEAASKFTGRSDEAVFTLKLSGFAQSAIPVYGTVAGVPRNSGGPAVTVGRAIFINLKN